MYEDVFGTRERECEVELSEEEMKVLAKDLFEEKDCCAGAAVGCCSDDLEEDGCSGSCAGCKP